MRKYVTGEPQDVAQIIPRADDEVKLEKEPVAVV